LQNENNSKPKCFEFIAKNEEILFNSSSGGVFPLVAKKILNNGGIVCGAAWKNDFSVEHIIIDNESDLYKLQKSKYLQSYMGNIFRQIKVKLEDGVDVLFSGSPCHIAGLRTFLKKPYNNLFCLDILCAQAPSAGFFKKYLKDTFMKKKVKTYQFRNKKYGWNSDSHSIEFYDGTIISRRKEDDPYQRVFKIMSSNVCNSCRYSLLPRQGDITIGDFWNINNKDNNIDTQTQKKPKNVKLKKSEVKTIEKIPGVPQMARSYNGYSFRSIAKFGFRGGY